MSVKEQIEKDLEKVLAKLGIEDVEPRVEYPGDSSHGDYASNVAMVAFAKSDKQQEISDKRQGFGNPRELAELISKELRTKNKDLTVEVAGPGFLNFTVSSDLLLSSLTEFEKPKKNGKKVVVEYSSPNIAKPFTVGHLRSTIIGDAVANLLEYTGYEVIRDNHIGDWGTQFGKMIYAIKNWVDDEAKIEKSDNPVKKLVELYVRFHEKAEENPELEERAREWFRKLENGDAEAKRLWQKCIDWSWTEFEKIYADLGVPSSGDFVNNGRGYGESYFEDQMQPVIRELEEKNLLKKGKEGAKIVEFAQDKKLSPLMIVKKDGATLYATRDLATDKFRLEQYGKDTLIINEVGAEQEFYFRQLYALEEMLGWVRKGQRVHVKHGLIRFADGKMSTRKGNTVWLRDVLDEAEKRAWNLQKHTSEFEISAVTTKNEKSGKAAKKNLLGAGQRLNIARDVGIGAIKWNDLKRSPEQEVKFDWDEALSMQGNSGPYIQYAYVRTQSVIDKSEIRSTKSEINTKYNFELEERALLVLLSRFEEVVAEAAERYAPNVIATYLFELAQGFNLFYQRLPILKSEAKEKDLRLFLTEKTGEVLKKGLYLLGIEAPEGM